MNAIERRQYEMLVRSGAREANGPGTGHRADRRRVRVANRQQGGVTSLSSKDSNRERKRRARRVNRRADQVFRSDNSSNAALPSGERGARVGQTLPCRGR